MLLRIRNAEETLRGHHSAQRMVSQGGPKGKGGRGEDGPRVLPGPKTPSWGCPSCGRDGNWASRIRCFCGKEAPSRIVEKARAAAKKEGGAGGPTSSSKQAAEIKRLRKELDEARAGKGRDNCNDASSDLATAAGTAAEEGGGKLAGRIESLEKHIKDLETLFDDPEVSGKLVEAARAKLAELREQQRASRTPLAKHARVQRQLAQAIKKKDAMVKEVQERQEDVAAACERYKEAVAKLEAQEQALATISLELTRTAKAAVEQQNGDTPMQTDHVWELGVDDETLEQFPELKWLHERREVVATQVRQAKEMQRKRQADAKAAAEAQVPADADDQLMEGVTPAGSSTAPKRPGQPHRQDGSAPDAEDIEQLLAWFGEAKSAPDDPEALREGLAIVLQLQAAKRAKTGRSG